MKKTKTVKTYHAHQGSAIVMGIFSLFFAASFALLFFFPAFTLTINDSAVDYNGSEIFLLGLGSFFKSIFPDISLENSNVILEYMNNYAESGSNVLYKTICGFHTYVTLAFSILGLAGMLFGLIVIVLAFVWFIRGRILIPKATTTIAHWSNGLFDACIGLVYGYLFIFGEVAKEAAQPATVSMAIYPFVILGIQAVTLIILRIVYALCYKNRLFDKDKKNKKESEQEETTPKNNTQKKQKNDEDDDDVEPEMVPIYNKGLPENLQMVGDHSFAADDSLTNAIIPEGVTTLGNGAFANCHNLEMVTIPVTVIKIGPNCFYNTPHLTQINYTGTKEDWRTVRRGTNWLVGSGTTTINTRDGAIGVNPNQ